MIKTSKAVNPWYKFAIINTLSLMPKLPGVNLITFARPEIQTKATVWVMLICKFNNLKIYMGSDTYSDIC